MAVGGRDAGGGVCRRRSVWADILSAILAETGYMKGLPDLCSFIRCQTGDFPMISGK